MENQWKFSTILISSSGTIIELSLIRWAVLALFDSKKVWMQLLSCQNLFLRPKSLGPKIMLHPLNIGSKTISF